MLLAHSDVLVIVHIVFATVNRKRLLWPADDEWWRGAIRAEAMRSGAEVLAVGNADDHVHLVAAVHPAKTLAELVQSLKGSTSRMWNASHRGPLFRWQSGYWARSVEHQSLPTLVAYVRDQRARHATGRVSVELEQTIATNAVREPG
jgi:putative transposase